MKKTCLLLSLLLVISWLLAGCADKYEENDFLGKTSKEIVSEFGEFDCVSKRADSDGLYRNAACGYTVEEPLVGFLGTTPEVLLFIHFDENGIAVGCEEGYRPGG